MTKMREKPFWRIPFPLIPPPAPAMSDDGGAPVRDLSHRVSHSGRNETPLSVQHVIEHFFGVGRTTMQEKLFLLLKIPWLWR